MSGKVKRWLWRRARDYVAQDLARAGGGIWSADPHRIDEAIAKVEQAWSLTRDSRIAVQLTTMYDRANRNDDALIVLHEAFRRNPKDALVRHHAAITLLRHGTSDDVRDFFRSVLKIEPEDAFAQFVVSLLESYDGYVEALVSSIEQERDGRPAFIIACPVWGQPFAEYFVRYVCASLLAPNNLPELARRHGVHLAVFTTAETEAWLRADRLFAQLAQHATVHFMRYSERQTSYPQAMQARYGQDDVYYSDRPLAFYYARNCKFALMSCAHYVALAAGRATDALVSCQVADTMLNDGALARLADRLANDADAVLINSLQIHGRDLRPRLDHDFRRPDGVLQLSSEDCTKLLIDHLPAYNFLDATGRMQIPLRACWRVGAEGFLVHGNHYHPIGLRPSRFAHPLRLTIDPIDSRFIDRTSLAMDRIHLVQDAGIVGLSIEEGPPPEQFEARSLSVEDVAFWLRGYWGRHRGALFRSPLRFGRTVSGEEWERTEAAASGLVDAIVRRAAELESWHKATRSWRHADRGVRRK